MADPSHFWHWFRKHEGRFRNLDVPEREDLLDELLAELHAFCDELFFEVGGRPGEQCELIISAEGVLEVFPQVRRLVAAAPDLPGWTVTAFKPPMGFDFGIKYEGITLAPEASWFLPLRSSSDPDALGLRIGYAHFDPDRADTFLAATYLMLDAGIGELAFAEKVQHVEVARLPTNPEAEGYIELSRLPEHLAQS